MGPSLDHVGDAPRGSEVAEATVQLIQVYTFLAARLRSTPLSAATESEIQGR